MSKKIAVITGSPRKNGNSFAMTEAFIQAAQAKGHKVTRFDAAFHQLGGCHGCMTCYTTDKPCTHDDDFNLFAPDILAADVIVFSTPVYWYAMTAQIKCVIDRMFCFVVGKKNFSGKQWAILSCCEEKDLTVFDGVRRPLERAAGLLHWESIGQVLITGVMEEGDILKTDGCQQAAALADQL